MDGHGGPSVTKVNPGAGGQGCGLLEQSQAVPPGLGAARGRGAQHWGPGRPRGAWGPRGGGGPFCHLEEHRLFRFMRGLCKESS